MKDLTKVDPVDLDSEVLKVLGTDGGFSSHGLGEPEKREKERRRRRSKFSGTPTPSLILPVDCGFCATCDPSFVLLQNPWVMVWSPGIGEFSNEAHFESLTTTFDLSE